MGGRTYTWGVLIAGAQLVSPSSRCDCQSNWGGYFPLPLNIDASPHDLRKTAATRLFLKDRWTVGEVQAFLGHRDPRTTLAIYTLINAASVPRPSEFDVETG